MCGCGVTKSSERVKGAARTVSEVLDHRVGPNRNVGASSNPGDG